TPTTPTPSAGASPPTSPRPTRRRTDRPSTTTTDRSRPATGRGRSRYRAHNVYVRWGMARKSLRALAAVCSAAATALTMTIGGTAAAAEELPVPPTFFSGIGPEL